MKKLTPSRVGGIRKKTTFGKLSRNAMHAPGVWVRVRDNPQTQANSLILNQIEKANWTCKKKSAGAETGLIQLYGLHFSGGL
jgi:hypothetical protein